MTGEEFAARYGVTLDYTSTGSQRDDDGWEHNVYPFTLTSGGRTYSGTVRAGLGWSGDIAVTTILEAVGLDARTSEESGTFEEYAEEFGYDVDSRRAHAGYVALRQAGSDLYDWCVSEQMWDDLRSVTEADDA